MQIETKKAVLLDSNLILGYIKKEPAAIEMIEIKLAGYKMFVVDIVVDEVILWSEYKDLAMDFITQKCEKNILGGVCFSTLNNLKKKQFWKWDSLFMDGDERLNLIIDLVKDRYKELNSPDNGELYSIHKNDIEILTSSVYYNIELATLDKKMLSRYKYVVRKLKNDT